MTDHMTRIRDLTFDPEERRIRRIVELINEAIFSEIEAIVLDETSDVTLDDDNPMLQEMEIMIQHKIMVAVLDNFGFVPREGGDN